MMDEIIVNVLLKLIKSRIEEQQLSTLFLVLKVQNNQIFIILA